MYETQPIQPAPPEWGAPASPSCLTRLLRLVVELVQTILIAGLLFLAVNFVTARIRVEGNSMEPSLHDGEFVVVNRLAYRWAEPQRGDIIVFRFPLDPGRRFIKRIIGLPGDTIMVQSGTVLVNGIPINEPYIAAPPRYNGEWELNPGELFVLGDNRNNSSDSQNWGTLPTESVIGKAIFVYWPPSEVSLIPHYDLAAAASP